MIASKIVDALFEIHNVRSLIRWAVHSRIFYSHTKVKRVGHPFQKILVKSLAHFENHPLHFHHMAYLTQIGNLYIHLYQYTSFRRLSRGFKVTYQYVHSDENRTCGSLTFITFVAITFISIFTILFVLFIALDS